MGIFQNNWDIVPAYAPASGPLLELPDRDRMGRKNRVEGDRDNGNVKRRAYMWRSGKEPETAGWFGMDVAVRSATPSSSTLLCPVIPTQWQLGSYVGTEHVQLVPA